MFHLTQKAYEDLKDIAIYTQETWGKTQRVLYLKMMDDAFFMLSKDANLGIKIDDIRKGYYKYKIGKHLIFYRFIKTKEIQITRILHQRMDVENRF